MSSMKEHMPDSIDQSTFLFVLSAIKHCPEFKPDWNEVAKDIGIAYGRNTPPKFNSLVKKFGYKYEKGVLTGPEDCEAGVPTKRVDHGKEGGKNQRAMLVTPKKRKTSGMFEEDEMAETKNDVRGEGMRQKVKQEKLA